MASVRKQILDAVEAKLEAVRVALGWNTLVHNPREPVGDDQFDALVMMDGGDLAPMGLTGHVEQRWLEFSVGLMVRDRSDASAEEKLDAGYVAVCDALLNPADIQLGGLAIDIQLGGVGDPMFGRAQSGARVVGGQSMEFMVQYLAAEGAASVVGP